MPVSEQTPINSYTANGVTTAFSYAFLALLPGDITVEVTDTSGNVSTKILGVDYTLSGIGVGTGGTVTFLSAPANLSTVTIYRDSQLARSTDYQTNGDLPAATLDDDFDRLWLAMQELFGAGKGAQTSLRVPASESVNRLPSAALRANKVLAFDATGQPFMSAGTGGDTALRTDLASKAIAASGSALVGHGANLNYAAGTIGAILNDVCLNVKMFPWLAKGDGATDDTAAIQAAITAAGGGMVFFPLGTYIVSSVITCPTNTRLHGESRDGSIIQRTAGHTGHTFVFGADIPGQHAGAMGIRGLWFHRDLRFNPGSTTFTPGTSTSIVNQLVGGQAHVYIHECQRGSIEDNTFDNMPYDIVLSGGSVTVIRGNNFVGSIWDQTSVNLQEGIAQIWFKRTVGGVWPTVIQLAQNDFSGGFGSAARNVTIGTFTANYAENIGPKFGLLLDAVEGLSSVGDYFGGHNSYSVYAAPVGTSICTNVKFVGSFFDGARLDCIHLTHGDNAASITLVSILGCIFNGELAGQRAISLAKDGTTTSALYSVSILGNVMMAFTFAPIYIDAAIGVDISGNVVSGYNCRTGNTGDPAGAAGCYVVGPLADKVSSNGNMWGGAVNNLSSTNNCQYGIFFGGTFTSGCSASNERSNGLGLAGGALITGGDSDVHLIGGTGQPAFTNAWVNFGGGFNSAGFYKDGDGVVHLQGLIKSGAITSAAFTLPVGFRPVAACDIGTASNAAFGVLVIDAAGGVTPQVGSNVWFSLESLSFKAA